MISITHMTINQEIIGSKELLTPITDTLIIFNKYCFISIIFVSATIVISALIEICIRIKYDQLKNLFLSIYLTFLIRKKLKKTYIKNSAYEINAYNRAIKNSLADIRNTSIIWKMKVPPNSDTIESIQAKFSLIKEELSNRNENYYFSSFERNKKYYYIIGTIRNKNKEGFSANMAAKIPSIKMIRTP